jgi:Uncharacterized protein conserved in bacteria (DUF2252)
MDDATLVQAGDVDGARGWRPHPARTSGLEHPSPADRAARGRAARRTAPRSSHGKWGPSASRPDPIELLEDQASGRLPELNPIRYGRMLVSPFTFFRGAATVMASDLSISPPSGSPG